ncbi:MAG: hypoxanthine-guanine phosphoribosyltransferase [Burkholderiales bacterium]|nr:hypoxanthine-guanine phosphoribosyltransferase [Burkholderiales bacterium]
MDVDKAKRLLAESDVLVSAADCAAATARMAREISGAIGEAAPLVLAVMGGATVFAGQLLPQLAFPLEFDYIHVSRYGDKTRGGALTWKVEPSTQVAGRTVLVLDDILDEGATMAEIRRRVLAMGATRFFCAVFCDKDIGRDKPIVPDFVGIRVVNRYVFGYGMDVSGLWRNLPAVHAVAGM